MLGLFDFRQGYVKLGHVKVLKSRPLSQGHQKAKKNLIMLYPIVVVLLPLLTTCAQTADKVFFIKSSGDLFL